MQFFKRPLAHPCILVSTHQYTLVNPGLVESQIPLTAGRLKLGTHCYVMKLPKPLIQLENERVNKEY